MPFHIEIPARVKTGTKLSLSVTPKTSAFTAALYSNPVVGTKEVHDSSGRNRVVTEYRGSLVQIEQENSAQEVRTGSKNDGVITLELFGRDKKPLKPGVYMIKAWAGDDDPSNGLEGTTQTARKIIIEK